MRSTARSTSKPASTVGGFDICGGSEAGFMVKILELALRPNL
jgi:hypothetical protein